VKILQFLIIALAAVSMGTFALGQGVEPTCFNTEHQQLCGSPGVGSTLQCPTTSGPSWIIIAPEIRTCIGAVGSGRKDCDNSGAQVQQVMNVYHCDPEYELQQVINMTQCNTAKLSGAGC